MPFKRHVVEEAVPAPPWSKTLLLLFLAGRYYPPMDFQEELVMPTMALLPKTALDPGKIKLLLGENIEINI